jgi:hypothetical protein
MNSADVRKLKRIAQRLAVRDSDVIRFAVKCMLGRLAPLYDSEVRGRNLVPVFVESGAELLRFFELDAARLEQVINEGVEAAKRVDRDDVALLALSGGQEAYAALMLRELDERRNSPVGELAVSLRQYLYEKYVYRGSGDSPAKQEARGNGDSQLEERAESAVESERLLAAGGRSD